MNPRLSLFPLGTQVNAGELEIGGCNLSQLAEKHGTPLYIYDYTELERASKTYSGLLDLFWPGRWSVTYAGKAFLCSSIARWAAGHGFSVDCTGAGEIGIAANAGLADKSILVHGVNKSGEDIAAAIAHAGTIVVDNLSELRRLTAAARLKPLPELWLRFQPGSSVDTHSYTQTGHSDSKFGMRREQILQAAEICRKNNLPLTGLHFHQGSQFRDPEPIGDGIDGALDLAREIGFDGNWHLSPGGGWGVAYHEDDLPNPPIEQYIRFLTENITAGCKKRDLRLPHLHIEPGRSLIARAGVAIYRVGTIKRSKTKTWVLVDGGMADNPRRALYGARYSCLPVKKTLEPAEEIVSIAGPYCESGDVLIEDIPLRKLEEDELLAIPVCGAYHLSMASNYNGARRPTVVIVRDGSDQVIQHRETVPDLLHRDQSFET